MVCFLGWARVKRTRIGLGSGVTVPRVRPRTRSVAMYDATDVRYGVTRKSQAKNVLLCKTEVGKVRRIERRDWWLISPVTTLRVEHHAAVANTRRSVFSSSSSAS